MSELQLSTVPTPVVRSLPSPRSPMTTAPLVVEPVALDRPVVVLLSAEPAAPRRVLSLPEARAALEQLSS